MGVSRIIVLGGGVCGLATGWLLARDGHAVTLLERDPGPVPDTPAAAWEGWERGGVRHFKQPHGLQPRARMVLERELPDVVAACLAGGAELANPLDALPPTITDRAPRPGDERFVTLHVRRPVLEQALAQAAEDQPGLRVRRGIAAAGLICAGMNGSTRVTGVRTDAGDELYADLVVDAMGRGSRLPELLADAGLAPGTDASQQARFVYYTRYFRGPTPVFKAPRLSHVGTFSLLTLVGDNGTWSVTFYIAAGDRPLKRLRSAPAFTRVLSALPRHAHWLDGEPITGVMPMAGVNDRLRAPAPAPGLVAVADAWGCTNPTLGRGIAVGLLHVLLLRDAVRERLGDLHGLAAAYAERTDAELGHFHRACLENDRVRLAAMTAEREGRALPSPVTAAERAGTALPAAMAFDADLFRAGLEIIGCLAPAHEVMARPGLAERALRIAGDRAGAPTGEPGRAELLELLAA